MDYALVAINTAAVVAETINEPPDDPRATRDTWIEGTGDSALLGDPWNVFESYNVLLSPAHPYAPSIQLGSVRPFQFDPRLWTPR
jgi:hypothetical protein